MKDGVTITLQGDALVLFECFLKYANTNTSEIAEAMYYNEISFKQHLKSLERAYNKANVDNAIRKELRLDN